MNHAVCASREVHEVLAKFRISGNDHGVTSTIDAISKRWFHSSMIDQECGNLHRTVIVCFTLADFFRIDFDAFGWKRIGSGLTNVDIKGKCVNKVLRHAASFWRAPYWKRFASAQNHPESQRSGIPTT